MHKERASVVKGICMASFLFTFKPITIKRCSLCSMCVCVVLLAQGFCLLAEFFHFHKTISLVVRGFCCVVGWPILCILHSSLFCVLRNDCAIAQFYLYSVHEAKQVSGL